MAPRKSRAAIVDALGLVRAQIASLVAMEEEYKEDLKRLGCGTYVGTLYDATVSEYEETRINSALARSLVPPKILRQIEVTKTIRKVNCVAKVARRKGGKLSDSSTPTPQRRAA